MCLLQTQKYVVLCTRNCKSLFISHKWKLLQVVYVIKHMVRSRSSRLAFPLVMVAGELCQPRPVPRPNVCILLLPSRPCIPWYGGTFNTGATLPYGIKGYYHQVSGKYNSTFISHNISDINESVNENYVSTLTFFERGPYGLRPMFVNSDRLCGLVVRIPEYYPRGPGFDSRHYQIS
jgi:hypothetical protein